jgi:hypothetical protein
MAFGRWQKVVEAAPGPCRLAYDSAHKMAGGAYRHFKKSKSLSGSKSGSKVGALVQCAGISTRIPMTTMKKTTV